MFSIHYYIKKREGVSSGAFKDYWLGEHAELLKSYVEELGVRALIKNEPLPDHPVGIASAEAYGTGPLRYDFVDTWHFNDVEQLKSGSENPNVQALMKTAHESEKDYIDFANSNVVMAVDLAQFYPPDAGEIRATPDGNYVKIFYVARAFDHLTREQAQLHWNACHGAVSRQDIKYSVMKMYVQCHAIESTFVNLLCDEKGFEVDPTLIGHAQGWIDVIQEPKPFPDAEKAEVEAMSMDDIDLFADKRRGCVFVAHEHYVIDKKVIVCPMPTFFSAVY